MKHRVRAWRWRPGALLFAHVSSECQLPCDHRTEADPVLISDNAVADQSVIVIQ